MQHLSGLGSKFTALHKLDKIVYLEEYDNLEQARRREKQIKGWIREKKERLIKGEWVKWVTILRLRPASRGFVQGITNG
jgi:putative endonuclease